MAEAPAFRRATLEDAGSLLELERSASLVALAAVFPPERFPYPSADVLARWHLVLGDPDTVVEVITADAGGLACLVAYDAACTLRHLAVAPALWGAGLGERAVRYAVAALRARGCSELRLWCLEENSRARRLYQRLGWTTTGRTQPAPWPPYPTELEYALAGPVLG